MYSLAFWGYCIDKLKTTTHYAEISMGPLTNYLVPHKTL